MFPKNQKLTILQKGVEGVKEVHNISSYSSEGKIYASLHVMVDREKNLEDAHKISEIIENKILKNLPEIYHITIHLEPFVTMPEKLKVGGKTTEEKIKSLLKEYSEIKKIGRIIILQYKNIQKIDIDCSFDGNLSIEKVHDLTSQIHLKIRSQFKNAVITIHPEPN